MKLIDMKREQKDLKGGQPVDFPYPYGLVLHFDNESLKKLGLKTPKVGSTVTVTAVGTVIGVNESSHAYADDKIEDDRSCDIQLRRIGITKDVPNMQEAINEGIEEGTEAD
jgi:hypothetical protein